MNKKIKRVACYVRVSTENQLENYSIDEQIDRLTAYCKAKDWNIVKFYTDGGYSGGNTERPALQQMLSDIEHGYIDMVVVYKLDRLSRSQKDTLTLIEDDFLANNVDFVSMSENFDTSTAFGRAMIGILSVFAQLEKDQITERFTMGRIGRAKNGLYHGGPTPPTGYNYMDGKLVVNEYEAMQVREVYDRFLKGQSVNSIYKYMSNKYGNWSSHTLVLGVLRNNAYIGKVKFKKQTYDGEHKPIISHEQFYQVQKLLKSEDRHKANPYSKTPFRASNILSSLLLCKHCGAKFAGNHGSYVCYSRGKTNKNLIKDPNCLNKRWDIGELDNIIKSEILKLSYDDDYIENLIKNKIREPEINTDDIKIRINEIDKQINRMIDLYQIGSIPMEQISDRIEKLKREKDAISESLINNDQTKITIEDAKKTLKNIKNIFDNGDVDEQRLVISTLVEFIEIDNDNIDIHWNFV